MQSPSGRDSMQFPRWIQGTWLEFHRVINADRASMMQSPAGRDSMQFPRWIPRDLVGVPSSDQRRPGQKYADVGKHWLNVCRRRQTLVERMQTSANAGPKLDAQPWIPGPEVCTTMDPWASMMHNHGSQGRAGLEFHRVINADRAGSMHNHGSQGQKYADVGKHWVNVCRRRQTLGERMQTSANAGPA
jgi:alkylated DNA nucleotide flippase Atl1